jgi:nucleolar GTP-binding protein
MILTDFPRLNDIHPFYSDLCNTLYDRDHYKLALGQINTARSLVDSIARYVLYRYLLTLCLSLVSVDVCPTHFALVFSSLLSATLFNSDMIRMVKYGDTLYRCKCLKRAALGRMCTVLKRQKASLAYLEEVRKHLSRLPALDPNTRTILMCGLPNVGKSSFMNKITRGNVDVQPYAFTTKSLFVGHTDYKYLRWQVIDTPGILDHPLEERNTIEMQAIIALAHLTCSVLYFVDISEACGYTIDQQCSLFRSIKPLFANKQLIIVVNKVDMQPFDTLQEDKKDMINALATDANCSIMTMSNLSEHGVSEVKAMACDKLLEARVDSRIAGKKIDHVMNRLQVFVPKPRDNVERTAYIPESVLREQLADAEEDMDGNLRSKNSKSRIGYAPTKEDDDDDSDEDMVSSNKMRKTARDRMWENGGPGVWAPDYREIYDLKDESWKFDTIPEIINGKNIADFVDADILTKLEQLEREEEQIVAELEASKMGEDELSDLDEEEQAAVEAIRERKRSIKIMKNANQSNNKPVIPHAVRGQMKDKHDRGMLTAPEIKKKMDNLGVDASLLLERGRAKDTEERGRKRERSLSRRRAANDGQEDVEMEDDISVMSKGKQKDIKKLKAGERARDLSVARSHSKPREPSAMGLKDDAAVKIANKLDRDGRNNWIGGAGEGDNRKAVHLVKWMNTGKKRNGTHYCR